MDAVKCIPAILCSSARILERLTPSMRTVGTND